MLSLIWEADSSGVQASMAAAAAGAGSPPRQTGAPIRRQPARVRGQSVAVNAPPRRVLGPALPGTGREASLLLSVELRSRACGGYVVVVLRRESDSLDAR